MITIEKARALYAESDAVHDFDHVLRVLRVAEKLAALEGADMEIVHAAALLHDVSGSAPGSEERENHHIYSAEYAGRVLAEEGWPTERIKAAQHCIRAHRYRNGGEGPTTIEAQCVFDADKLDVIGAIGAARTIAYATLAGEPFYSEPSQQYLESGREIEGEPHSAYHEYLFKLRKIKDRLFTPAARKMAEHRDRVLRDYFEELAVEMKAEK
jgi:uncharacterized protein